MLHTELSVNIGKRPTPFKKLDILLHNEFNEKCLGRTRFFNI